MTIRRVGAVYDTWVEIEPDPNSEWDTGAVDGAVADVRWVQTDFDRHYNDMETDLDGDVWVVVAGYNVGDSFGSGFEAVVCGVFATEWEAETFRAKAESYEGYGSMPNGFVIPWNGYFESLKSVEVKFLPSV